MLPEHLRALRDAATTVANEIQPGEQYRPEKFVLMLNRVSDQLLRVLDPSTVDDLLFTQRCLAIVAAANGAVAHYLIAGEVTALKDRLSLVCEQLAGEVVQWDSRATLVVADTNVYLHHAQSLRWIDWRKELDLRPFEHLCVIVPIRIVDELDKAKRSAKTKLRARETLRELSEFFAGGSQLFGLMHPSMERSEAVWLQLLLDDVHHPGLDDGDSEIIATAVDVQQRAGRSVTILTGDVGMSFRARQAGLQSVLLELRDDEAAKQAPGGRERGKP